MPVHTVQISLTAKDTSARLAEQPTVAFKALRLETHTLTVDPSRRFQKMEGFGGGIHRSFGCYAAKTYSG
jgi:hypothetical protein